MRKESRGRRMARIFALVSGLLAGSAVAGKADVTASATITSWNPVMYSTHYSDEDLYYYQTSDPNVTGPSGSYAIIYVKATLVDGTSTSAGQVVYAGSGDVYKTAGGYVNPLGGLALPRASSTCPPSRLTRRTHRTSSSPACPPNGPTSQAAASRCAAGRATGGGGAVICENWFRLGRRIGTGPVSPKFTLHRLLWKL